jgi:tetratricopeptide (TPR) repeat protein
VTAGRDPRGTVGLPSFRRTAVGTVPALIAVVLSGCSLSAAPFPRAVVLAEHGQAAQAIQVLEADLQQHPTLHEERRLLIRLYGASGDLDAARRQSERLAEFLPFSPLPSIELGEAYELAHHYEEALAAYDRAAAIAPESALGPQWAGLRATRWGELDIAETRLEEAVRRDARDAALWHALGLVRLGLGKLDAARRAYMAGLTIDPRAIENRLGLATVALRRNEPQLALAEYEALLTARPGFRDALLGKSWSLILIGHWKSAAEVLSDAEARDADPDAIARQRLEMRERKQKALELQLHALKPSTECLARKQSGPCPTSPGDTDANPE